MNNVVKIAITGGPCGGKSELLKRLQEKYGDQLTIMPEIATQLLEIPLNEGGVGIPGQDVEWSPEWQNDFQSRIIEKQLSDETYLTQVADLRNRGVKLVICDRGILDGAAYEPLGREAFMQKHQLTAELCHSLYDVVIHLNSLATDQPELYDQLKHTNPSRFEDADTAKALDEKIALAYEGHPNLIRIPADGEFCHKLERCEKILIEFAGLSQIENEPRIEIEEANRGIKAELDQ